MQIRVARLEKKPTAKGGTLVAIYDEKGTRFSGFDSSLSDLKEGDLIEADIKVDGKFNNIQGAVRVLEQSPHREEMKPDYRSLELAQMDCITRERIAAFQGVVQMMCAGLVMEEGLRNAAWAWARERLEGERKKTGIPELPEGYNVLPEELTPEELDQIKRERECVEQAENSELAIDYDALVDNLRRLKWGEVTLLTYLATNPAYKINAKSFREAIFAMTEEQQQKFDREVKERLIKLKR